MPLIDRVKERTKSDLSDPELQALIDENEDEIVRRYGARATDDPITVEVEGGTESLILTHPIVDELEIVETDGDVETTLDETDYRVWNGGRRLQRLDGGVNPRSDWAGLVTLTYNPVSMNKQRDETIIKLITLSIDYEGVKSENIDDHSTSFVDYHDEREKLLQSLAPNRVLLA